MSGVNHSNKRSDNIRELYEMGPELGKGHYGVCVKVTERATGNQYACKMIEYVDPLQSGSLTFLFLLR